MILYTKKRIITEIDDIAFIIDDDQVEKVKLYSWKFYKGYVRTNISKCNGPMYLHILLFGNAAAGLIWDHINRNKLDNRRKNLRQVTYSVNSRNRDPSPNNKSGVVGVSFDRGHKRWQWWIQVNGVIRTGTTKSFEEAVAKRREEELTLSYHL